MKKKQKKKTKIPTSIEEHINYEMVLGALGPDGKRECGFIRTASFPGKFNPIPEGGKTGRLVIENVSNPGRFIKRIKENPELVYDDKATQATITFLHRSCFFGNEYIIEWAEEILKAASLDIFIPERPKRHSKSPWITYWKHKPYELEKLVETYETEILSFTDSNKTWRDNEPEFKQYYQDKYKRVIPENLLKGIKISGSKTDIALLLISDEYDTNSPSLPDKYKTNYPSISDEDKKDYPPHYPYIRKLYYTTKNRK